MEKNQDILKYYREELKWDPPFADVLSRYSPDALEGYFTMRKSVQDGELPRKIVELIFTILDALDDEASGAKAHAVASIEAGLTVKELVEAFNIVTMVKGINVLCKTGINAIKAAEERYNEISEGMLR
ncbi:carboxymuconolactone decarboxylase family protein [Desulfitobacterium metallireducens]|uniref:Carboxymuconolactone decarboxylase n=1 Tax=Desulfitobacterium metallireducens DSM 15288 TaxID=871968 RepID=W0EDV7_9FIRM|nr:carboxymuconolactone decarboxylase family protein [Desulfitobacterium metallireducens]AHF07384.1 carboxymuconolactone decarboxylase [Desulfitobacterium metallireducens DSM 15288]